MQTEQTDFYTQLQSFFEQVRADTPLKIVRKKAFDRFLDLGLPDKNSQAFQYVSLKNLFQERVALTEAHSFLQTEIDDLICDEAKSSYLVFVNGFFQATLSNLSALSEQIVVMPLEAAIISSKAFKLAEIYCGLSSKSSGG